MLQFIRLRWSRMAEAGQNLFDRLYGPAPSWRFSIEEEQFLEQQYRCQIEPAQWILGIVVCAVPGAEASHVKTGLAERILGEVVIKPRKLPARITGHRLDIVNNSEDAATGAVNDHVAAVHDVAHVQQAPLGPSKFIAQTLR